MRRFAFATLLVASTAAADVSIVDNHKTVTVDCAKDKTVSIVGNHAKVTLNGTCSLVNITGNHAMVRGSVEKIFVAGNHNTIAADSTDDISTPGNRNTVTWKQGTSKKAPAIKNPGKDNKISQVK